MEPDEQINRHKLLCKRYFESKGMEVHIDIPISEQIRWRPHLYIKDGKQLIIDILDLEKLPTLQLKKYVTIRNALEAVDVYILLIGDASYLPEVVSDCYKYGIGIFVITNGQPREVLPATFTDVERLSTIDQIAIEPGKPYGNVLALRKCLKRCKKYIRWFERNMPISVFEVLYENVENQNITGLDQIQLLRCIDDKMNEPYRNEFKAFRDEVALFEIGSELRVICDRAVSLQIHGRFIYSEDESHNETKIQLPPLNSLRGNQWDTIFTNVERIPPFEIFWAQGIDIIQGWDTVKKAVEEYLKHKKDEAKRLLQE